MATMTNDVPVVDTNLRFPTCHAVVGAIACAVTGTPGVVAAYDPGTGVLGDTTLAYVGVVATSDSVTSTTPVLGFGASSAANQLTVTSASGGTAQAANFSATTAVYADHINEYTGAHGCDIDGVLCKDNKVSADHIGEKTGGHNLIVDSTMQPSYPVQSRSRWSANNRQFELGGTVTSGDSFYMGYQGDGHGGFGFQDGGSGGWFIGSRTNFTTTMESGRTWGINVWDGVNAPLCPSYGANPCLTVKASATVSEIGGSVVLDEDTMTSNSATKICTQQSIKAYNDSFHTSGTMTQTWSGIWAANQSGDIRWVKSGKMCTIMVPVVRAAANTSSHIHCVTALPNSAPDIRPAYDTEITIHTDEGGTHAVGPCLLGADGSITIYKTMAGASFAGVASEGFLPWTVTYITAT